MKLRVLAVMAIAGTIAASFAYADNAAGAMSGMNDGSAMSGAAAGTGTMSGNVGSIQDTDKVPSSSNAVPPSSDANNTDDMSADTASGDDDY